MAERFVLKTSLRYMRFLALGAVLLVSRAAMGQTGVTEGATMAGTTRLGIAGDRFTRHVQPAGTRPGADHLSMHRPSRRSPPPLGPGWHALLPSDVILGFWCRQAGRASLAAVLVETA
jgi:hypothetical protein